MATTCTFRGSRNTTIQGNTYDWLKYQNWDDMFIAPSSWLKFAIHHFLNGRLPIIVDEGFGIGVVNIMPARDSNSYEVVVCHGGMMMECSILKC
jgi:hypothetical protein